MVLFIEELRHSRRRRTTVIGTMEKEGQKVMKRENKKRMRRNLSIFLSLTLLLSTAGSGLVYAEEAEEYAVESEETSEDVIILEEETEEVEAEEAETEEDAEAAEEEEAETSEASEAEAALEHPDEGSSAAGEEDAEDTDTEDTDTDEPAVSALSLDFSEATEVSYGESVDCVLEEDDSLLFSFTADQILNDYWQYIFYTTGNNDTYIQIYEYDEDEDDWIGWGSMSDDDSGEDFNALVDMYLDKGETIYIEVELLFDDDGTGAFTFCVGARVETWLEEDEIEEYNVSDSPFLTDMSGTTGDVSWAFTVDDQTLTISGSGAMADYVYDDWEDEDNNSYTPWDENNLSYYILKVVIEDGVTHIGDWSFYWMNYLEEAEIADSVTSIGDYAFQSCYRLETAELPDKLVSIGEYAFAYCEELASITFPSSLTSIGEAAYAGCTALTSVEIPENLTSLGDGAFRSCSGLTAYTVADGNTAYTAEDGVLYNSDQTLLAAYPAGRTGTSYSIPSSVTEIGGYAFYGSLNLTKITVPGNVVTIGDYAFSDCSYVKKITLGEGIVTIGEGAFAFVGDYMGETAQVSEIEIPEGVTTVGDYAFYHIYELESISLPSTLTYIGECAFSTDGCVNPSYTEITIPANVTYIGGAAFGWSELVSVTFLGDAPEFGYETDTWEEDGEEYTELWYTPFQGVTADVYYDSNASGWTDDVLELLNTYADLTFYAVNMSSMTAISSDDVTLSSTSYTYTGNSKKPTVTVKVGSKTLTKDTHYTVSYSNNKEAGTATVTIKAKGSKYYGTVTKNFTIKTNKITSSTFTVSLSTTTYTYSGSVRKPTVTIKNGSTKISSSNYSVSYASGRKAIGKYKVTIKGKNSLSGTVTKYFKIVPKKVSLKSSSTKSSAKKKLTVAWSKSSGGVKYQIAYKKKGGSWKYKKVSSTTYKKTLTGLTSGKYYYVKVRAYKTVSGTTYYGSWSSTKKVKVK